MASIPLHCNICPKKPDFSDVSHLLTHIASKGHLSHYYKLKVKSGTEPDCRELIEEYDQWYAEWSVEDLMSERMNLKDKKRPRNRVSARLGQAVTRPAPTRRRTKAPTVDPHAPNRPVKQEIRAVQPLPPVPPATENHSFAPEAHMWHPPGPNGVQGTRQLRHGGYEEETTPTKSYALRQRVQTARMVVEEVDDEDRNKMRRKRNQKKDTSVLEQLEHNSLEVEATEHMWSPSGTLQRSKFITGLASSSPFKLEPSPKRQRSTNERPPLFDLNTDRHRRNGRAFADDHAIFEDEQLELELTYGTQKRKRGFDIFQDPPETSFENPAPFNYLTSEFHYPNQYTTAAVPSYNYKPYNDPFRYTAGYEERPNLMRGASYHEEEETLTTSLYDPQSIFCSTASSYQPTQYYHGIVPQDYGALYTSAQTHNPFQSFPHCAHPEQPPNEVEDDERTISAPPSDA